MGAAGEIYTLSCSNNNASSIEDIDEDTTDPELLSTTERGCYLPPADGASSDSLPYIDSSI